MTPKQEAKLSALRWAVADRGKGNTVEVISSLPEGRVGKASFPLDSSVVFALVNGRGHVAIGPNGAVDLPFVRSFPGSYFAGAVLADQLEAQCDPNGFKAGRGKLYAPPKGASSPTRITTLRRVGMRQTTRQGVRSYFQLDGQQRALGAYVRFISGNGWAVKYKLDLYDASRCAFAPTASHGASLAAFEKIDSELWSHWGLARGSSGPHWSAERTFGTIVAEFSKFAWRGPIILPNFRTSDHTILLSSLERMRGLKPMTSYPVMAVSKFLHFCNPSLFPIYDGEVIYHGVLRCFRNDFKEFCAASRLGYEYEDTPSFLYKYVHWASSLIASAHPEFMSVFVDWLGRQPGAELHRRSFDPFTLYATAFEFTVIGAWRVEALD